jgi:hypothetical protein
MNYPPAAGKKVALATPVFKGDGFVKSPSAALRFIFSHCGVLVGTPHS